MKKFLNLKKSRKMDKLARELAKDEDGMAAIEAAFILPVMLLLLFGLLDITDGLSASRKVTITANTLGDIVSQEPGTTNPASLDGIFTAASQTMVPFNTAAIGLEVFTFRNSLTHFWEHRSGTSCGNAPTITNDQRTDLMAQGNDLIITRACYQFSYMLSFLVNSTKHSGENTSGIRLGWHEGGRTFTMQEQMTLRPRRSLQLDCPDCVHPS